MVSASKDAPRLDGRLERGKKRRHAIIEGVLAVTEDRGASAVSHRSVAATLSVSPSAISHHFATVDDLLTTALESAHAWIETAFASVETVEDLASVLWDEMKPQHRGRLVAVYELYLLAARRPALRPSARVWSDALHSVGLRLGSDELGATALVAVVDGLGIARLLGDEAISEEAMAEAIHRSIKSR